MVGGAGLGVWRVRQLEDLPQALFVHGTDDALAFHFLQQSGGAIEANLELALDLRHAGPAALAQDINRLRQHGVGLFRQSRLGALRLRLGRRHGIHCWRGRALGLQHHVVARIAVLYHLAAGGVDDAGAGVLRRVLGHHIGHIVLDNLAGRALARLVRFQGLLDGRHGAGLNGILLAGSGRLVGLGGCSSLTPGQLGQCILAHLAVLVRDGRSVRHGLAASEILAHGFKTLVIHVSEVRVWRGRGSRLGSCCTIPAIPSGSCSIPARNCRAARGRRRGSSLIRLARLSRLAGRLLRTGGSSQAGARDDAARLPSCAHDAGRIQVVALGAAHGLHRLHAALRCARQGFQCGVVDVAFSGSGHLSVILAHAFAGCLHAEVNAGLRGARAELAGILGRLLAGLDGRFLERLVVGHGARDGGLVGDVHPGIGQHLSLGPRTSSNRSAKHGAAQQLASPQGGGVHGRHDGGLLGALGHGLARLFWCEAALCLVEGLAARLHGVVAQEHAGQRTQASAHRHRQAARERRRDSAQLRAGQAARPGATQRHGRVGGLVGDQLRRAQLVFPGGIAHVAQGLPPGGIRVSFLALGDFLLQRHHGARVVLGISLLRFGQQLHVGQVAHGGVAGGHDAAAERLCALPDGLAQAGNAIDHTLFGWLRFVGAHHAFHGDIARTLVPFLFLLLRPIRCAAIQA